MKPDFPTLIDLALTSVVDNAIVRSWALIQHSRREVVAIHRMIEQGQRAIERSRAALGQGRDTKDR